MTDRLLTSNDQEEELSRAYIKAVAAMAGYTTGEFNLDRDGTDVQIRAGGSMRPSLDIQIKATTRIGQCVEGQFRYPPNVRNYDILRVETVAPNILVLLFPPSEKSLWLTVTPEELVIRRCAYWASLKGLPETENKETITISIRNDNKFDVENLKVLMELDRKDAIS